MIYLVPKLYLGIQLIKKLCFGRKTAMLNFANNPVPKFNLGTRGKRFVPGLVNVYIATTHSKHTEHRLLVNAGDRSSANPPVRAQNPL